MKRVHLFEFEDLNWFPDIIRQGGTDYLRHFLKAIDYYGPIPLLLHKTLKDLNEERILDLCSGGGGSIEMISKGLKEAVTDIQITVSDKYPNIKTYKYLKDKTNGDIDYIAKSIDATTIPGELKGFRTMFSAIHHFPPDAVKQVLNNAVQNKASIGIFDGGDKNIVTIIGILIVHPIVFLLCTPFFRPFKFSRLFFTYILPIIPLYTIWDGCVSILRLYHPLELLKLAKETDDTFYIWRVGKVKNKLGMNISYLIGYPKPS